MDLLDDLVDVHYNLDRLSQLEGPCPYEHIQKTLDIANWRNSRKEAHVTV